MPVATAIWAKVSPPHNFITKTSRCPAGSCASADSTTAASSAWAGVKAEAPLMASRESATRVSRSRLRRRLLAKSMAADLTHAYRYPAPRERPRACQKRTKPSCTASSASATQTVHCRANRASPGPCRASHVRQSSSSSSLSNRSPHVLDAAARQTCPSTWVSVHADPELAFVAGPGGQPIARTRVKRAQCFAPHASPKASTPADGVIGPLHPFSDVIFFMAGEEPVNSNKDEPFVLNDPPACPDESAAAISKLTGSPANIERCYNRQIGRIGAGVNREA